MRWVAAAKWRFTATSSSPGDQTKLGQPEVRLGIMPGAGGTQRFVRAAGKYQAMRWLMTGDQIPAQTAYEIGLVSEVVPEAEVQSHALKLAEKIARLPPLAIEGSKQAVIMGAEASLPDRARLRKQDVPAAVRQRRPHRRNRRIPRKAQA